MRHQWKAQDQFGFKDRCTKCDLVRYKNNFKKKTRYFRDGHQVYVEDNNSCKPTAAQAAAAASPRSSE